MIFVNIVLLSMVIGFLVFLGLAILTCENRGW